MANSADIIRVQDGIENEAAGGWSAVEIAARLDAGQSVNRTIESYWRKRAQEYLLVVSTSEAGSTRGNDVIYSRMVAVADKYEGLAVAEETKADETVPARGRIGSFGIRRV